jgi:hypothetical protein
MRSSSCGECSSIDALRPCPGPRSGGERLRLFGVVLQKARTGGVGFDNVPALPLRCWSGFSRLEKGLPSVEMLFAIRAKGIGPEDPPTGSG